MPCRLADWLEGEGQVGGEEIGLVHRLPLQGGGFV